MNLASDASPDCPWWAPPVLAVQFLTRLPVPGTASLTAAQVATGLVRAVAWFPLVGALVGAITAAVALAAAQLWPPVVAVLIALAIEARLTGAFHEDAVADFCDAFGGGSTPEDVRRILKDSRIGSYGSVGLILAIGLRAALSVAILTTLTPWVASAALIGAATFGRLVVVVMMTIIAPAPGGTGLAKDVGTGVGAATLMRATATAIPGLAAVALFQPVAFIAAICIAGVFCLWLRGLLRRRIGGSTGDCLGFAAYMGQLILLLAAAAR
ncbi:MULTISPECIES: adenosylcobinamide-GDP ribazoletransferase [unclassified Sphingomonas]|jgi:adenosylcobinamide-GDP ribazoletransferase|uniref:adenosylcobinamide-GDP ribazoletransferase n=1 Tax=unclassified Sphingomonas TaxID=196159 RepID=UPI000832CA20|nr:MULTISPECIES: adenosylcobinamide-GDP ribazoletransferase [unclassified Sphingomonas]